MSFDLESDEKFIHKPKMMAEINMTPFVDVCLVLLIIFMVTAPFAVSGVNVQLPRSQAKPLSLSNESYILSVTKNGEFFLGKNKIESADLMEKIKSLIPHDSKTPLFIRADKDVPYSKVMIAMEAAQHAGVERIGMVGENKNTKK